MSARSGIYFLLKTLNFERNSEVIVCGFTCEVVPAAIIYANLTPKYIDIDFNTLSIDKELFFQNDFSKVKAIIIQHTFGISGIDFSIINFCKEKNIFIIEDCSLAIFSEYNGNSLGIFGDASVFSFEISKSINSVRGGVVIINSNLNILRDNNIDFNYKIIPKLNCIKKFQLLIQLFLNYLLYNDNIYILTRYILFILYKFNFFRKSTLSSEYYVLKPNDYLRKMPFFIEKFIFSQLQRSVEFKFKNQFIHKFYLDNITNFFNYPTRINNSNYLIRFPILVQNKHELIDIFKQHGYEIGSWFDSPLASRNLNFDHFKLKLDELPRSSFIAKHIINLPMHHRIKKNDLFDIINLLKKHGKNVEFKN